MTHQCHDCKNFTDGKCCHETKEKDFNLNNVVATALESMGDDKNIENHVAPQCVVGGDQ